MIYAKYKALGKSAKSIFAGNRNKCRNKYGFKYINAVYPINTQM